MNRGLVTSHQQHPGSVCLDQTRFLSKAVLWRRGRFDNCFYYDWLYQVAAVGDEADDGTPFGEREKI